jgi:hypothetical protein
MNDSKSFDWRTFRVAPIGTQKVSGELANLGRRLQIGK